MFNLIAQGTGLLQNKWDFGVILVHHAHQNYLQIQLFYRLNNRITGNRLNREQQTFLFIKADQGCGLLVVGGKAMADCLFSFIFALDNFGTALVADSFCFWGIGFYVVDCLAIRILAGTAGTETIQNDILGHINVYCFIQGDVQPDQQLFQGLCLGNGARKTV